MNLLWWHWAVFGFVLLIAEIFAINSTFLIWFGLGALLLAVFTSFLSMPLWAQLLLFAVLSVAMLAMWIMVLRPMRTAKNKQQALKHLPGSMAFVVHYNGQQKTGTLRLQRPIAGKDVWEFRSDTSLRQGARVTIESLGSDDLVTLANASDVLSPDNQSKQGT